MEMFKHELKQKRERAGLSRRKASELLGVTGQTIGNWESGLSEPPPIFQSGILNALDRIIETTEQIKRGAAK